MWRKCKKIGIAKSTEKIFINTLVYNKLQPICFPKPLQSSISA